MSNEDVKALARELKTQAFILGGFIATFWILEIIDVFFLKGALNYYGIRPRNTHWLEGILFAPFLHGNFLHLAANTLPFVTLGWLVMLQETSDFLIVTGITALVSGLGVWLFGASNTIHIGASGLIFGYLGFLLLRGYFQRNFISILLSAIVGFFYGGLLWGMLPLLPGISWQGHFFGFVGGVLAARMLSRRK
ncbi:MAG: rhomboid family intramembrane serine protease [Oscillatoriaceae bacterium SKW80]|nr:rhomboid family intramembrane serine protease [Oscillatoriaceae bacterium SKYG93]MCX8121509.1 rhomboid family intramembrane serine protease [Oscillatoriaceae bacterium SKW80]MDW8452905.1 rhomboid family intramembrane serine protease [Oscillatoriaceae cyanobacterium SKYGB_i_bin93]HIK27854.1 rhomboid family intramembrane serine protease [Oscillatoriaceae cyanobacterium M7585_C2015_266]